MDSNNKEKNYIVDDSFGITPAQVLNFLISILTIWRLILVLISINGHWSSEEQNVRFRIVGHIVHPSCKTNDEIYIKIYDKYQGPKDVAPFHLLLIF